MLKDRELRGPSTFQNLPQAREEALAARQISLISGSHHSASSPH